MRTVLINLILLAIFPLAEAVEFPHFSLPRAITSGPHEHFFASYYAVNAWSSDGRYALVLQTDIKNRLPTTDDVAVLGVVDMQDNNSFTPLTETRCWNFQEATMAHWLGNRPEFVFNDLVDGAFVAVIYNVKERARRVAGPPVSAVSRDGKWAVSINYARLRLTRPDYGYDGSGQDARADTVWPEDDGLRLVNLETGESKLILSIAAVRERMPEVKDPKGLAYFCHTVFNYDASRIFWLARSVENLAGQKNVVRKWETTAFVCGQDGSDVVRCFPDGWGGSHFNWLADGRMVVTAKWQDRIYSHVLFTPGKNDHVRLGYGLLDFDGHCVYSDDGKWMSTDSYRNQFNERKLVVMRPSDQAILPLGEFLVPELYQGTYWRCDLHARWRPDGKMLGFNSVHEGSRQVYVIDVISHKK